MTGSAELEGLKGDFQSMTISQIGAITATDIQSVTDQPTILTNTRRSFRAIGHTP
jgi:hypothetical protein